MYNVCKNCGRDIRIMIYRGGDWCSDDCRKVLLGKVKCFYETIYVAEIGEVDVCVVHGENSQFSRRYGSRRPCLAVEPY